MFGWLKRLINKTVSSYEPVKPKTTTITVKDLKNKTKKELERIGRKLGGGTDMGNTAVKKKHKGFSKLPETVQIKINKKLAKKV